MIYADYYFILLQLVVKFSAEVVKKQYYTKPTTINGLSNVTKNDQLERIDHDITE